MAHEKSFASSNSILAIFPFFFGVFDLVYVSMRIDDHTTMTEDIMEDHTTTTMITTTMVTTDPMAHTIIATTTDTMTTATMVMVTNPFVSPRWVQAALL